MMHLKFSEEFCIEFNVWVSDKPLCCRCKKPVDWYGRKIEMDKLGALTPDPELEHSRSYSRIYVVRCHGSAGMINMSDMPKWDPYLDPRPEAPQEAP